MTQYIIYGVCNCVFCLRDYKIVYVLTVRENQLCYCKNFIMFYKMEKCYCAYYLVIGLPTGLKLNSSFFLYFDYNYLLINVWFFVFFIIFLQKSFFFLKFEQIIRKKLNCTNFHQNLKITILF